VPRNECRSTGLCGAIKADSAHPVKAGLLGLNISNYFKYIWWLCASSVVVLAVLKTE